MMARGRSSVGQGGFTLIEAVIVIVIIGVLGAIVAVFIRMPLQGYQDSVERAELTDLADLSLRRMARDLRLALPNSIVTSNGDTAISFFITKTGGRYLAAEDDVAGHPVLDFLEPANTSFAMIGPQPGGKQAIVPGRDYVVVNNLGVDPANAYSGSNMARVTGFATINAAQGLYRIDLAANPFAQQNPPMPSPNSRFQVVGTPVTYRCTPGAGGTGNIVLQSDYGIVSGAPGTAAGTSSLLSERVSECRFDYSVSSSRGALVVLTLVLQIPGDGKDSMIRLTHQVHVDNTP